MYAGHGVQGILVNGTTGEWWAQSRSEREDVARTAAEAARGAVPVVVGVTHYVLDESVRLAHGAAEAGAAGVLATVPPYVHPTEREALAWYRRLAERSPLPVMVYNWPRGVGVDLSAAFSPNSPAPRTSPRSRSPRATSSRRSPCSSGGRAGALLRALRQPPRPRRAPGDGRGREHRRRRESARSSVPGSTKPSGRATTRGPATSPRVIKWSPRALVRSRLQRPVRVSGGAGEGRHARARTAGRLRAERRCSTSRIPWPGKRWSLPWPSSGLLAELAARAGQEQGAPEKGADREPRAVPVPTPRSRSRSTAGPWPAVPGKQPVGGTVEHGMAGVLAHPVTRRPRGPLCGMGVCQECLVQVSEAADASGRAWLVRSCLEPVPAGLRVRLDLPGTEGGPGEEGGQRHDRSAV